MKIKVKVSPSVIVEAEGDKQTDLFEEIAQLQEVFGQEKCGKCGGTDLRYVVREVDDNKYFELRCKNIKCRASLAFGQHKKGGSLFPKIKDGEAYIPNNGWQIWDKEQGKKV